MKKMKTRIEFSTSASRCYACDAKPVGIRDRRPEGGDLEHACARHADPTLQAVEVCFMCCGAIRRGSLDLDGSLVHAACYRRDCADVPMRPWR
jgi:hypothetical protein